MTATPRDPKSPIETLLKRWRVSLELHQRYARLDHDRYWHVQPWPRHERPIALILNLAQEKLATLERITKQRVLQRDREFLEALELMALLSNLVGLQNIERFVPLADAATERRDVLKAAAPAVTVPRPASAVAAPAVPAPREDATRQMPALQPGKVGRLLMAQQAGVPYKPRATRATAHKASSTKPAAAPKATVPKPAPRSVDAMVVDDVVRLIGWGRATHELPDLIASMTGRPNAVGVQKIMKEYRVHIQRQLGTR